MSKRIGLQSPISKRFFFFSKISFTTNSHQILMETRMNAMIFILPCATFNFSQDGECAKQTIFLTRILDTKIHAGIPISLQDFTNTTQQFSAPEIQLIFSLNFSTELFCTLVEKKHKFNLKISIKTVTPEQHLRCNIWIKNYMANKSNTPTTNYPLSLTLHQKT